MQCEISEMCQVKFRYFNLIDLSLYSTKRNLHISQYIYLYQLYNNSIIYINQNSKYANMANPTTSL